jgi:hypothetical protein
MKEKEKFYFQHDYTAASDIKIQGLMTEFGGLAYAIFFGTVELLHQETKHKLPLKEYVFRTISNIMVIKDPELVKNVVRSCIDDYGLFVEKDGYFYSNRVMQNFKKREEIKQKRAEAGRRGGKASSKQDESSDVKEESTPEPEEKSSNQNQPYGNQKEANAKQVLKQNQANGNKGKERKGKETKKKENALRKGNVLDIFLSEYPKQINRAKLEPVLMTFDGDLQELVDGVRRLKAYSEALKTEKQFIPNAENFIRNKDYLNPYEFTPPDNDDELEDDSELNSKLVYEQGGY